MKLCCLPAMRSARAVSTVLEQCRRHPFFAGLTRDEFLAQMAALPEKNDLSLSSEET